jgi:4-hydroxybenzoate polyprenyltransferase
MAASAAFYAAGMVLNDVFDAARDQAERPGRPIPSGRISRASAALLGVVLLAGATALSRTRGPQTLRLGVVLAACILCYDGLLKRTPLAPPLMGACRALNLLLGASVSQDMLAPGPLTGAVLLWLYVTSLTFFARFEASMTTRARVRAGWAGMTVALFGQLALLRLLEQVHVLYLLLLGVLLGDIMVHGHRASATLDPADVRRAVKAFVLRIIVFDACLVFAARGPLDAVLVLVWLIPSVLAAQYFRVT